jgi:hypothetical protein
MCGFASTHITGTNPASTSAARKAGRCDPTTFDDRYDAALVELVKVVFLLYQKGRDA